MSQVPFANSPAKISTHVLNPLNVEMTTLLVILVISHNTVKLFSPKSRDEVIPVALEITV